MDGSGSHRQQALHLKSRCFQLFHNIMVNCLKIASISKHNRSQSLLGRTVQWVKTTDPEENSWTLCKIDEEMLGQWPLEETNIQRNC